MAVDEEESVAPRYSVGDFVSVRANATGRGNAAIPRLGHIVAIKKKGSRIAYTIRSSVRLEKPMWSLLAVFDDL